MHDRSRRDSAAPPALPAVPADADAPEEAEEPARRFTIETVQHEGRSMFQFTELPSGAELPPGAEFDNSAEDTETGDVFHLYALPGTHVIGRTFAWILYCESMFEGEGEDPEAAYFAELYSQNLCIRCGAGAEDASQYCGACADASWEEGEEEPC